MFADFVEAPSWWDQRGHPDHILSRLIRSFRRLNWIGVGLFNCNAARQTEGFQGRVVYRTVRSLRQDRVESVGMDLHPSDSLCCIQHLGEGRDIPGPKIERHQGLLHELLPLGIPNPTSSHGYLD